MTATQFKFEIGQTVFRFGSKVKIVDRRLSGMGKAPTYEIEEYYMGNKITVSAWQDELSLKQ